MVSMRHTGAGWFFAVTGFLACPCHLVITLPLAVALLSGTALGGWIATHEGGIAAGATVYFVGALAVGFTLLSMRRASEAGSSCALPTDRAASDGRRRVGALLSRSRRAQLPADGGFECCQPEQHHDGQPSSRPEPVEPAVGSSLTTGRDG